MKNIRYIFLFGLFITTLHAQLPYAQHTLEPIHKAHLGQGWYEQNPDQLTNQIDHYLTLARTHFTPPLAPAAIKAIIVPHAGHYYSGLCAATAYTALLDPAAPTKKNNLIKRVIILAPSHTHYFRGVGLPSYQQYQTPLGTLPVDRTACIALSNNQLFTMRPDNDAREHAIEIQLPFIQRTIEQCSIIPLIIGANESDECEQIGKALLPLITNDTLVIISSDFVHYGAHYSFTPFNTNITDNIRSLEAPAIHALLAGNTQQFNHYIDDSHATICGRKPIAILLTMLNNGFHAPERTLCCYYTSNHMINARTAGTINLSSLYQPIADTQSRNGSVSYAACICWQPTKQHGLEDFSPFDRQTMLAYARRVIRNQTLQVPLPDNLIEPIPTPSLCRQQGVFVTLYSPTHQLRGCIGRITSDQPLHKTIHDMSIAAAFHDNRFKPVSTEEIDTLKLSITVLSQPTQVSNLTDIILGKHGIILRKNNARGTLTGSAVFLPRVPVDQGWNITTTLEQLCIKAGLCDKNAWQNDCVIQVFEGTEIHE